VTLTFSEAIQDGTFTLADVTSLTGPGGSIAASAVNRLSSTQYEVVFASQSAAGNYSLVIGPNITDAAGNAMNQDNDAANGEDPADQFTASFSIAGGPAFSAKYDFGTAGSPLAAGYTRVTAGTAYSAAQGFGWQSGTIGDRDRGTGSSLTRDLNFTSLGAFGVDLPDGTYTVTVMLGDAGPHAHDQQGVILEGTQVDSVTTDARQSVTRVYTVTVNDGQLTLLLDDLGGSDPNVTIQGLEVAANSAAFVESFAEPVADPLWYFEPVDSLPVTPRRLAASDVPWVGLADAFFAMPDVPRTIRQATGTGIESPAGRFNAIWERGADTEQAADWFPVQRITSSLASAVSVRAGIRHELIQTSLTSCDTLDQALATTDDWLGFAKLQF
jgi:hypothetical protein